MDKITMESMGSLDFRGARAKPTTNDDIAGHTCCCQCKHVQKDKPMEKETSTREVRDIADEYKGGLGSLVVDGNTYTAAKVTQHVWTLDGVETSPLIVVSFLADKVDKRVLDAMGVEELA